MMLKEYAVFLNTCKSSSDDAQNIYNYEGPLFFVGGGLSCAVFDCC